MLNFLQVQWRFSSRAVTEKYYGQANHANSVTDCSNVYYSKTFTVLIFNSAFDFFGFDIILLLITIFTFKWCREISFESYHGSMILTNLSQLSSESLSVKYTQKVY